MTRKINIVIDNPQSWLWEKAEQLKTQICKEGYSCEIFGSHEEVEPDSKITFFLGCLKFIAKETREKSKHNIVIHESDLPEGRGFAPATWQILAGKNEIPVTLFEVSDGFDGGPYYLKDSFTLDGTELVVEWRDKLYKCVERMVLVFIDQVVGSKVEAKPQKGKPTVYPRRRPRDSELDPKKTLATQFNLFRVVDNERYPAFFRHKGKKYLLKIDKESE